MASNYDAVVIGAGISGLAAASELVKAGLSVVVLDSEGRIGGRIHTVETGHGREAVADANLLATAAGPARPSSSAAYGHLELGATWIHGHDGNPLHQLAEAHGLLLLSNAAPKASIDGCEAAAAAAGGVSAEVEEDLDDWDDTTGDTGRCYMWRCRGVPGAHSDATGETCPFSLLEQPPSLPALTKHLSPPSVSVDVRGACTRTHAIHPAHLTRVFSAFAAAMCEAGNACDAAARVPAEASVGDVAASAWSPLLEQLHDGILKSAAGFISSPTQASILSATSDVYSSLWRLRSRMEQIDIAAPSLHQLSKRWYGDYYGCDGDDVLPIGGMQRLVDIVALPLAAPEAKADIKLEHEVSSINYGGIDVVSGSSTPLAVVQCSNGAVFRSRIVIVTVSLGVLKAWCGDQRQSSQAEHHLPRSLEGASSTAHGCSSSVFHPCLPSSKVAAIRSLGFGCVEKVHTVYDTAWWRSMPAQRATPKSSSVASRAAPVVPPDLGFSTLASPIGHSNRCSGFAFLSAGAHNCDDNSDDDDGCGFDIACEDGSLNPPHQSASGPRCGTDDQDCRTRAPAALTWWAANPCASSPTPSASIAEITGAGSVSRRCTDILRHHLSNASGLLYHSVPEPISVLRSSWSTNPNFRGSYTYPPVGLIDAAATFAAMASPVIAGDTHQPEHGVQPRARSMMLPPTLGIEDQCSTLSGSISCGVRTSSAYSGSSNEAARSTASVDTSEEAQLHGIRQLIPRRPVLLFAGEATHRHHYSTTHGAYESGLREGQRAVWLHSHSVKCVGERL